MERDLGLTLLTYDKVSTSDSHKALLGQIIMLLIKMEKIVRTVSIKIMKTTIFSLFETGDGGLDDVDTVHHLSLVNDQRRGEPNNVPVGWFGQQASVSEGQTKV